MNTAPDAARSRQEADWLRRDAIREYAELFASLAVSLDEAALRGSDALAALHLRQIVAVAKTAAATLSELGTNK